MDITLLKILMSWAVLLSQYPAPSTLPIVEYKPQSFFVEHACKGNPKCDIWGWYNDEGVIYLINWMDNEENSSYIQSFPIHEMVHYLQDINGKGGISCEDINRREREAYYVQRKYIVAYGHVPAVSTKQHLCNLTNKQT